MELLTHLDERYKDVPVYKGICASMAITGFFEPININNILYCDPAIY